MNISDLLLYYRDCYQTDMRGLSLTNFFSAKVENKLVVDGQDELLNAALPHIPVDEKWATATTQQLQAFKREKALYCCAFFIIGTLDGAFGKNNKACAPLLLYPTELFEKRGHWYASISHNKAVLNYSFLQALRKEDNQDVFELFGKALPKGPLDFETIGKVKRLMETHLAPMDAERLLMYPDMASEQKIKRLLQPKWLQNNPGFHALSSLAFGVVRKSTSTMGVISELRSIAKSGRFSPVVQTMALAAKTAKKVKASGRIPASLSKAQKKVLTAADENILSLVIGPPGTGKSFTIACLAIEYLSKGKSVLIASKTNQAVDVVGDKIESQLGLKGVAVRAGRSDYKKALKAYIKNLLASIKRQPKKSAKSTAKALRDKIDDKTKLIAELESDFEGMLNKEIDWGQYLADNLNNNSIWASLKFKYIQWRIGLKSKPWKMASAFKAAHDSRAQLARQYVRQVFDDQANEALQKSRVHFVNFSSAISARQSARQERIFEQTDFGILLKTFPIWLVNMADIHQVLPLESGLFDVAIIDEATQCDIASSLPILQRAKRAVIVGDPKQLRHVSFLSQSVQATLQKKHNLADVSRPALLDYRNHSLLDMANEAVATQDQVSFLDEHFRSTPKLIGFSNQHFYDNSLRIMTSLPWEKQPESAFIHPIDGVRQKDGTNHEEAEAVIKQIATIIEAQDHIDPPFCQSIGVLSPFRDQAEYLSKALSDHFSQEAFEKHDIACGTAYAFQGEERDVMLLSFAIDNDAHSAAFRHLNNPEVFNVAITRARSLQHIFISFDMSQLSNQGYLKSYLTEMAEPARPSVSISHDEKDQFMHQAMGALNELGYEVWANYEVAGLVVDIVVGHQAKYFGIDLIGYPGVSESTLPLEDYKILARAGLKTMPLPYTAWIFDQNSCIREVKNFVETK